MNRMNHNIMDTLIKNGIVNQIFLCGIKSRPDFENANLLTSIPAITYTKIPTIAL